MALSRERISNLDVAGNLTAKTLMVDGQVVTGGGLKVVGGQVSITGSGQFVSGLTTITSVAVSLGQDLSVLASGVSATWLGSNVTIKVTMPKSATDSTPVPSKVATIVNWQATGN